MTQTPSRTPATIACDPGELLGRYDGLLVDLDGTVFEGGRPIPGAGEALAGHPVVYVTNNASRSPQQVADHLRSMGITAGPGDVLTSAQAACALAADVLAGDLGLEASSVHALVLGAESFRDLAAEAGFTVTTAAEAADRAEAASSSDTAQGPGADADPSGDRPRPAPHVVLHGHSPATGWRELSEAALAIRGGAVYIASNLDTTLPSERGFLVGNGSMVAAVTSATGVTPRSAGKPGPDMFHVAARRLGASRPLAVGDRLDTDIAGGIAAWMDTLCVLTGVSGHRDILTTPHRPTFVAASLSGHCPGWRAARDDAATGPDTGAVGGGVTVAVDGPGATGATAGVVVHSGSTGPVDDMAAAALGAAAPLAWELLDAGHRVTVTAADEAAATALEAWR
ncbi:HAD-IIA family hydrolase [Corynebacterium bovis]|uniref:HAD-IIA family hydrolase n=1 Tax=Corynebacterium bovis TaxID=36808 RepID=UPI00244D4210|nr:HAD-IIA family hydrolase [Corynebacterium bovis]MDH2454873.1 HAD-IIA family hydrolase [Corynebacterium bovis]